MGDLILSILTSSVISSLIVVACNLFLNQKKNSLEYITNERSLWRKEIRKIVEEIEKADKNNINIPLTKLKVRINVYDKYILNKSDTGDKGLWALIKICENTDDLEYFEKIKGTLIMAISLMLKYDWEKSKEEVSIHRNNLLSVLCIIVQLSFFAFAYYWEMISFIVFFFFVITYIIFIFILCSSIKMLEYRDIFSKKVSDKINIFSLYCGFVIGVYLATLLLLLYMKSPIMINGLKITDNIGKIIFDITILMPTLIYFILGIEKGLLSKYRLNYVCTMTKILEDLE